MDKNSTKELKSFTRIISNKARCLICNDVVESTSLHDANWCSCNGLLVDGGKQYLKRSCISRDKFEEMSEIEEVFLSIQEVFKYEDGTVFSIPKISNEEVILILCGDGIKRLFNRETGRRILMAEDYLNARYQLGECVND